MFCQMRVWVKGGNLKEKERSVGGLRTHRGSWGADCVQTRCGLPRGGCCRRWRSSAPLESIPGNSSRSQKQRLCGPPGSRRRRSRWGPGSVRRSLKVKQWVWAMHAGRTQACVWVFTSSSMGPNASFSTRPWLLEEMSLFCTSSSGDRSAAFSVM